MCVVGGGIAGTLLSWRLAPLAEVALYLGQPGGDATGVSGGIVRGWEPTAGQRALALDSLAELVADPALRSWAGYVETGCVIAGADAAQFAGAAAGIDARIPDSVQLLDAGDLRRRGWDGPAAALYERRAGRVDPKALRRAVLADLRERRGVTVHDRPGPATPGADVTVVAAGAWTPTVLCAMGHANGSTRTEIRTKAIRCAVHRTGAWRPPAFIDTTTGLYGTPTDTGLLLGLPTEDWDLPPGACPLGDPDRAARLARRRFPLLELAGVTRRIAMTDAYCPDSTLALRPVAGRLFTFTGGSGGAAKSALAASRIAADQIVHAVTAATAATREDSL